MAPRRDEGATGLGGAASSSSYQAGTEGRGAAEETAASGSAVGGGLMADYIVVGAGASGCVLAATLAKARPHKRVVLLDMGPHVPPPQHQQRGAMRRRGTMMMRGPVVDDAAAKLLREPHKWGQVSLGWRVWGGGSEWWDGKGCQVAYLSRPQPHLGGRVTFSPRGVGAGGCTLVNAMQYGRGYLEDYSSEQGWPSSSGGGGGGGEGGKGAWSQDEIRQSFEAVESQLSLVQCPPNALSSAFAQAARERGLPEGKGGGRAYIKPQAYSPMTYMISGMGSKGGRGGERQSTYDAFVWPLLLGGGTGLEVVCGTRARRVVIQDGRAVGVRFVRVGVGKQQQEEEVVLSEGGEVVLCAGALETPRVLMLSGVGDMAHLEALGLPTIVHCESVGRNLQDHVLAPIMCLTRRWLPDECRAPNAMHGWANLQHHHHTGAAKASSFRTAMRTQLIATDFSISPDVIIESFLPRYPSLLWRVVRWWLGLLLWLVLVLVPPLRWLLQHRLVGYMVCVMNGKSVGTVRLSSGTDPDAPLDIDCQWWSSPEDVSCLALGLRWARHLLSAPALAQSFGPLTELLPSTLFVPPPPASTASSSPESTPLTEAEVAGARQYAAVLGGTYFHPVGTCRFGSVVDERCRVRGVAGLRVGDVSVLVRPVGAGTVAVAMMIGHRVATLMLQDDHSQQQHQQQQRRGSSE